MDNKDNNKGLVYVVNDTEGAIPKVQRVKEKEVVRYVVATLNEEGKAMYLHSLHGGKYELTDNIEYATKVIGQEAAKTFYGFALQDFEPYVELVLIPLIITYELVKEELADEVQS